MTSTELSRLAERVEAALAAGETDAAMEACGVTGTTAESLALHTQAVLQGAFIMAKARGSAEIAADTIDHLIRYIRLLFNKPAREEIPQ